MIMSDVTIRPEARMAVVVVQMRPQNAVGSDPIIIAVKSQSLTGAPMPASSSRRVIMLARWAQTLSFSPHFILCRREHVSAWTRLLLAS